MKLQHILWIMNLAAFSLCPSTAAYLGVRPRIRRNLDEMDVIGTFSKPDVHNYSVLKMSIRGDVLYVGARDAILALNPRNITEELHTQVDWSPPLKQKDQCSWKGRNATTECFNFIRVLEEVNDTCLLVCGTYAFQPTCAYIHRKGFSLVKNESNEVHIFSGRGMSPYNPADTSTATFAGGKLYSGTSNDFLGGEHVIQRTVGAHKDIDSEHQKSWLNEPRFVASEFVPEDADSPEDDKIYYFFTEIVSEFDFGSKVTVSRIARVCKGDKGGQRLLIRKWTSFLKAQLECSLQSKDLYFNQLIQDVFTLHQNLSGGTTETTFYATFTTQMGELNISTVCKYDLTSVREVFLGKFKEERNGKHKWSTGMHSIPKPRPGQCLKGQRSQSLPDQTLKFVRDHSLMNAVVQPSGKAPLLVSDDARYTHLAVERLTSLSGRQLDVLYLATDRGFLHKAINVDGKMYLFEELRLFEGNQSVQNLLLHPHESVLYVASASQVLQLRTANCATLKTCADCLLARDPHCAWDTLSSQCRHVGNATDSKKWKQDVENANVAELCPHVAREPKDVKEKIIQKGVALYMSCSLQSHLASIVWERDDKPIPNNDKHYEVLHNIELLTTALVIKSPEPKHNGTYVCWAEEGQFRQQIEVYAVSLPRVPPTTTPQATTTTMSTTIRTTNTIISTATAHVATTAKNHQVHSRLDEMQNPVTDIPTTALPAATAAPCSACPCCSRPVLSASSPKPSAVPRISRPKNVRPVPLRLLPPLLVEQNQTLCDSHQVLLVCRAAGPPGVRITWTKAGDTLSRAQYSTDAVLVEGGRHQEVLSWLFVSVHHDTVFGCSAHWGTDVRSSYTKLHVAAPSTSAGDTKERPSPVELVQWKTVAHNHAYMMDLWHKAWTDTCHGNEED